MFRISSKRLFLGLCLFLFCSLCFSAGYEFVNKEITEILYSISMVENQSIIGDDTVSGYGTFRFFGNNFEEAFDSFLLANRLYVDKSKKTWVVSKIRLVESENVLSLDCYDLYLDRVFEYISEKSNITIIYSSLPQIKQNLHLQAKNIQELISLIIKNFDNYEVKSENSTIIIEKKLTQDNVKIFTNENEKFNIEYVDNKFNITLKNVSFDTFLERLKEKIDFQFISIVKDNPIIYWVDIKNQDFDFVLNSICNLCNIKISKNENLLVFYSDYSKENRLFEKSEWVKYKLSNISAENFVTLFRNRFENFDIVILSNSEVLINQKEDVEFEIRDFITKTDVIQEKYLLKFNYISANKFLENLPKDFSKKEFFSTGIDSTLFFYGTKKQYDFLSTYIFEIDKPRQKISYDLLIIQTQKSRVDNWNANLKATKLVPGNQTDLNFVVAPRFSFNMDLVQAFGILFATELQASIQENETEVFADTTLYGVSDVPIQFKNTNTFRYRDPYINLENGNQIQSGITKEIVSGLVLEILGSVSGNGTITTSVTASVSRRGADVSNTGNPPPTSEKLVTTQVIGTSGDVIVLSGLVQNDSTFVEDRVPLISKIPILGKLFSSNSKNTEKTEMIIYLVPHLDESDVKNHSIVKNLIHQKLNFLSNVKKSVEIAKKSEVENE